MGAKKLNNMYWVDAVMTTICILNRSPNISLDNMTPYEAWYEKKPNVNHFKVFGCFAYDHDVVDEKIRKLDPKIEACIFINYYENTKAYRLYNSKTHKVVVSRDAIFY